MFALRVNYAHSIPLSPKLVYGHTVFPDVVEVQRLVPVKKERKNTIIDILGYGNRIQSGLILRGGISSGGRAVGW